MNASIEAFNAFAPSVFKSFVWPMFWQSSLLIALVLGLDLALRRKLRPSVRYALWLVVLIKLVLPPSLALPTGLGWWVRPSTVSPAPAKAVAPVRVTYGPAAAPVDLSAQIAPVPIAPPRVTVSQAGWVILGWSGVSFSLLAFMLLRWRQVAQKVRKSSPPQKCLTECVDEARRSIGLRRAVSIRLFSGSMSPAVYGLFRPEILLPESLASRLAPAQLRAVLLHELIHLRRGDVWVNCVQALLQIVYWWHPLLWLANARIRRVREEAVDDAVMLALRDDAETYAATLLEVAKFAFRRPFTALGLVGILESRTSLRQRIERLIDFHPPRKAGLTLVSALSVLAFAAAAVPMGQAPDPAGEPKSETIEALAKGPAIRQVSGPVSEVQRTNINARVEDARRLFEMGTIKEAKQLLLQVVKEDPRNQEAYYYLNLINEREFRAALKSRDNDSLPPDESYRDPNLVYTNRARRAIHSKLDKIRLAEVKFDDMALSDVIANLSEQAKRRDPEKKGINFILNRGPEKAHQTADKPVDVARVSIRIVPSLTDVRLADVLDAIVKVADKPIKYSVEDYGVVFSLKALEAPRGRRAIYRKLDSIRLNEVKYDGLALSNVIADLSKQVKRCDPDKQGIMFILTQGPENGAPTADKRVDVARLSIRIVPSITDVRLADVLDAIVKVADKPIKYSVEDYGVVFSLKGREAPPLYTRIIKVDPNEFREHTAVTNESEAFVGWLNGLGVDLSPPKSVFFKWTTGTLIIRATLQDLDIIQQAVQAWNAPPPLISIRATFIEMPEAAARTFWEDFVENHISAADLDTATTQLPEAQAREYLAQWKSTPGVSILNEAKVTTESGRQTEIQAGDTISVVTYTNSIPLGSSRAEPHTNEVPIGTLLDVMPTVGEDGVTMQLVITASITDFLGYNFPGADSGSHEGFAPPASTVAGGVFPRFQVRALHTGSKATVRDGRTLVMFGGMINVPKRKNGVSALGDLDLFSRGPHDGKPLLLFITPTIIDPAGNRVHADAQPQD